MIVVTICLSKKKNANATEKKWQAEWKLLKPHLPIRDSTHRLFLQYLFFMTGEVNLLPFIPDKGDNKKNIMQNKNIKNYSVSVRLVKIEFLSPLNLKVHSNNCSNCSNGECHYSN